MAALRARRRPCRGAADGFEIRGVPARLRGGRVDAAGDHRIAMLGAVAGVVSQRRRAVHGADALGVSFPDFSERLAAAARDGRDGCSVPARW